MEAVRKGAVAALYIDGRREIENHTEGTEMIDAQAPLYIGGLPSDLLPFASRILPVFFVWLFETNCLFCRVSSPNSGDVYAISS